MLLEGGSSDIPDEADVQTVPLCELVEELRVVRKKAEESSTKIEELEKSQQEAERASDDALTTLQNEGKAAGKDRLEATKKREKLTKDLAEAAEFSNA